MRISVIVPVHNAARYLEGAVLSAVEQDWPDKEVVIFDDGSTDGSSECADALARARAPLVRVLHGGVNLGVSEARNRAAEAATGDALAFLDADDVYRPRHLRAAAEVLAREPGTALVFARVELLREGEASSTREVWGGAGAAGVVADAFARLLRADFVPLSTAVCRRAAWREAGGFETGLRFQQEDHLLWTRIAHRHAIHDLGTIGALYRVHADSYSARGLNEHTASEREIEYLDRVAAALPLDASQSRAALREAWGPVGERILYRLWLALRAADGAALRREVRALWRVPGKARLAHSPLRWHATRVRMRAPARCRR